MSDTTRQTLKNEINEAADAGNKDALIKLTIELAQNNADEHCLPEHEKEPTDEEQNFPKGAEQPRDPQEYTP